MKNVIPVLLMMGAAVSAGAQTSVSKFSKNPEHRAKVIAQSQQSSKAAHKTTAAYYRISATASYAVGQNGLSLVDSGRYKYSNARGSFIDYSEPQVSDYGLQSDISYDTATKYQDMGNGLEDYALYFATYNSNNKRTVFADAYKQNTQYENNSEQKAVLNANGDPTSITYSSWNSSQNKWEAMGVQTSIYDNQNKKLVDSFYNLLPSPGPEAVTYYSYDGNGNLAEELALYWDGSDFDSSDRTTYTYYPNNKLKEVLEEEYTTMWENKYYDSLGYTAGGDLNYRVYREWDDINSVWENYELEKRTYNSNSQPTVVSLSEWDDANLTWEKYLDFELKYDSRNNISRMDGYNYVMGVKIPIPAFTQYVYYEEYYNVNVKDAPKAGVVTVYPNPASGTINVKLSGMQNANVHLTNMSGQLVRNISAGSQQALTINLVGLPAGNYILTVADGNSAPAMQMVTVQ